jgi:hypothetical protein
MKKSGIILYIEDDFVGRDICLLAKDKRIPLVAISEHIMLEDNKSISREHIISNPHNIVKTIEEFLRLIPTSESNISSLEKPIQPLSKIYPMNTPLIRARSDLGEIFNPLTTFAQGFQSNPLNWSKEEYDRREWKKWKDKYNKENPGKELEGYGPGAIVIYR